MADLYPFVLSRPVVEKLRFVHDTIGRREPIHETAPDTAHTLQHE